jgi:hypothetical protein
VHRGDGRLDLNREAEHATTKRFHVCPINVKRDFPAHDSNCLRLVLTILCVSLGAAVDENSIFLCWSRFWTAWIYADLLFANAFIPAFGSSLDAYGTNAHFLSHRFLFYLRNLKAWP